MLKPESLKIKAEKLSLLKSNLGVDFNCIDKDTDVFMLHKPFLYTVLSFL